MKVRFLTGYGPQEGSSQELINKFYATLEEEIINCEQEGCGLVAELDCNAKLGARIVPGDPNEMSINGRLLWEILERRECTAVNSTEKCRGVITRSRIKGSKKEESVLDYFITNSVITQLVERMEIDETKVQALTRFYKGKAVPSDHNILKCVFNVPVAKRSKPRTEIHRLRNTDELLRFKEATSHTKVFTSCLSPEGDVNKQGENWIKMLKKTISTCFKKIRIRDNYSQKNETQRKIEERKTLLKEVLRISSPEERFKKEDQINLIEQEISQDYKDQQLRKVTEQLKTITGADGKVNIAGAWKLRRKVCPKPAEQLSAKRDENGTLVTNPDKIKDIYLKAYSDRLQHRKILPELMNLKQLREDLFQQRLEESKKNKSPAWTVSQLDRVLNKLKPKKATDPVGLVNELFMPENIGCDLKDSLLMLLNKIKDQHKEPEFMRLANITSFWKRKGARDDIENERGIFILNVIRMIKDRMIYNDVKKKYKCQTVRLVEGKAIMFAITYLSYILFRDLLITKNRPQLTFICMIYASVLMGCG